jgi:hypothetical protein
VPGGALGKKKQQVRRRKRMSLREKIRNKANRAKGSNYLELPEGVEFFKPKEGGSSIDIIPYIVTIKNHSEGIKPGEQ